MASHHQFHAALAGDARARPVYARSTGTAGVIDLLGHAGEALDSGVSADELIVSVMSAKATATGSPSGWHTRRDAYIEATGAAANVAVSVSVLGVTTLTDAGAEVEDLTELFSALLWASGFADRAMAQRRQAVNEGRVW
jgi:hypothetical protein